MHATTRTAVQLAMPTLRNFVPFLQWITLINKATFRADLIAALTGAVIVLPQGVAFAMIAGLPPQYGLYTAIVTPIIAALFGSSRHLISGPTTAISIVVFSAISNHAEPGSPEFVSLALTLTFLAGVYQLAFGLARLGGVINFVSHSVVVGFTAGAAILIATSQMKHVLSVEIPRGESFLHTWSDIVNTLPATNGYALLIAGFTLVGALAIRRWRRKLPHMLIAMVGGGLLGLAIGAADQGVKLVGEIPSHLPPLSAPDFSFATLRQLAPEALAIAVLGLIEAVSIGRSIATKSGQRIDGDQEFVGQGLSNIVGSFFSSYAGSGSFTRSGINYQSGAQTPLAAILAVILLAVAPLAAYLPIPAMGGIIILVAYNLIDFKHIRTILRASRSEGIVLGVTFSATLLLDLEFAIYAGVLLSLVLHLNRTAHPKIVALAPKPEATPRRFVRVPDQSRDRCPQLEILEVTGSMFFGSVDAIAKRLAAINVQDPACKHVLIEAHGVDIIDVSGAEMLVQEALRWRKAGGALYLCGLKIEEKVFLKRGGYLDVIDKHNVFINKSQALATILRRLDPNHCQFCDRFIYKECHGGNGA